MLKAMLLLLLPWPLAAQTALSIAPDHCVWKEGDDLRWAAPKIDESGWKPLSEWSGLSTPTPFFWLRCSFDPGRLAAAVQPALQVSGNLAWQAYANGKLIGEAGDVTTGAHTSGWVDDYAIGPAQPLRGGHLLVAVRMTFLPEINAERPLPSLALGDAELQRNAYYREVYENVKAQAVTWVCYALIASAGLFFLALYWFDRSQRFVLWVSLTWLSLADLRINEFLTAASVHYPARVQFFLYAIGQCLAIFGVPFIFALNQRRVPLFFRAIIVLNVLYPLALTVAAILPLRLSMRLACFVDNGSWVMSIVLCSFIGSYSSRIAAFLPLRTLPRSQIPFAIVCFIWTVMDWAYSVVQFPFLHLNFGLLLLAIQPYRSLAIATVVIALTLLLVQRIRAINRDRAVMQGELEAARSVQKVLIPDEDPSIPGFKVETVYRPASQVGGDFFQVVPTVNGAALIVIGDVSGKGMPAAMTVSLLIGTFRTLAHFTQSPAEILAAMNQRMLARSGGGFTTCLALRLDADGSLTAANAGHLAPYLNGEEISIESGLPLGLDSASIYPEFSIRLPSDGRLTLVTDGVVEAKSVGGELFGFEHTREISNNSAEEIAGIAQAFGQEDDITVLTLSFAPIEAVRA